MNNIDVVNIFDSNGPSLDKLLEELFKLFLIEELKKENIFDEDL